ncbi:FAD-dependent monooxygenase [Actinomadura barringtoniae]|uniref:FAD-dependent monooxygenase n=1 Tax=Actinomadura barringtoniae TaxID=1427535 RepID=A0A939PIH2_9ACTN|nr:FAD-dependent monooxygenase [Actinomadura barringtoniae]MBO2453255.1 FAD-dependent monooxygenase [Actinomadura barringtoniae]
MDTDVIISGAGPVGLMLATELALHGVGVIVLERSTEPSPMLKAFGLHPRCAETMELRGLVAPMEAMRERMGPGGGMPGMTEAMVRPAMPRAHFAGIRKIRLDVLDTTRPGLLGISQGGVETVLAERAAELGVEVRKGTALTGLTQDADGVTVRSEQGDELRARYLVGCDGGRSTVRKLAGFAFPGWNPTITGRLAGVTVPDLIAEPGMGWHRLPGGILQILPGRVIAVEFDGAPEAGGASGPNGAPGAGGASGLDGAPEPDAASGSDAASEPEAVPGSDGAPESGGVSGSDGASEEGRAGLAAAFSRVAGRPIEVPGEIAWSTRFTDNTRLADTYRRGRVLLAGDAAHVHSPFGGQGLNLGLQDAVNLGWKLAAAVAGWAPEDLLDSYGRERRPIAARVLHNTRAQVALMNPDPRMDPLYELFGELLDLPEANRHIAGMLSGLEVEYDLDDADPMVGAFVPDLHAEGRSVRELCEPGLPVLLDGGSETVRSVAAGWLDRVTVVPYAGQAVLIRPDGYVAWAGADADGLADALGRWFGRPGEPVSPGREAPGLPRPR